MDLRSCYADWTNCRVVRFIVGTLIVLFGGAALLEWGAHILADTSHGSTTFSYEDGLGFMFVFAALGAAWNWAKNLW